jgi:O-acetyl-ADP-ribose deacetylase (regulator of RNase III)
MLIALAISEAARRRLKLNLGGGVGYFKSLRGAVPVEEYDAVYDRHLPSHRRLGWATLRMAGRLASRQRQITV